MRFFLFCSLPSFRREMSTDATHATATKESFDQRFATIRDRIQTFHGKILQDSTKGTYSTANMRTIPPKLEYVCNTLTSFLAHFLQANPCNPQELRTMIASNRTIDDPSLDRELETLLQELCPLMMPWDSSMNAQISHLIQQILVYPFSPNASHRVDGQTKV